MTSVRDLPGVGPLHNKVEHSPIVKPLEFLPPTRHTLPVGIEHALLEHARRKDGEHLAIFHFSLFGEDLLSPRVEPLVSIGMHESLT